MLFISILLPAMLWSLWCGSREELVSEVSGLLEQMMEKDYAFLCQKVSGKKPVERMAGRIVYACLSGLFVIALKKQRLDSFTLVSALSLSGAVYLGDRVRLRLKYTQLLGQAKKEFPYYLNHLAILIQNNPVANAIEKSIAEAPKIFQTELEELVIQIHESGAQLRPYLQFASCFPQIEDLSRIMRTLFSLSITAENREAILTAFSRIANEKIQGARKLELQRRMERQNLIPYVLFLWLGFVILTMIASIRFF